jgi:nitrate/TMAO reductase-like tetraheme cytochrome c subunit
MNTCIKVYIKKCLNSPLCNGLKIVLIVAVVILILWWIHLGVVGYITNYEAHQEELDSLKRVNTELMNSIDSLDRIRMNSE